jgi:rhodanese-related sulfurtransferase
LLAVPGSIWFAQRKEGTSMPLPEFKQLVDEARSQISEIGPDELRRMQQSGEDFTLVDVRERDEQAKGTIPGAINLPRGILEVNIDKITTDKDRKLVLYCGGGSRSALAALNLKKMGFRNVLSLAGGYRDWRQGDTY